SVSVQRGLRRGTPARYSKLAASGFRALGSVLGAALAAITDAGAVQRAAHRVVAHARQILDAAAADQDDRVLLEVVAFTADVARDLEPVGQAHARHLAHRGVRLLGRGGVHARADTPLLRAAFQ